MTTYLGTFCHAPVRDAVECLVDTLVVVEAGGARLVLDAECSGATLDEVLESVATPETLASMGTAAGTLGRRDAAQQIARAVARVGGWT